MHRKRIIALLASAAIGLGACTVSARPTLPTETLLTPAVLPTPVFDGESSPAAPPNAANGALIYAEKCAACHGPTGAGDGPRAAQIREQGQVVADLTNPTRVRTATPSEWHSLITNGRLENLMPGFSGSLNAQERWDVQAYVWSLGTTSQTLSAGQALYQAQCASCHGADGGTPVGAAQVTLNSPQFLAANSLLDISNEMVRGEAHSAVDLTEAQRFEVADYVRSLNYTFVDPAAAQEARMQGDGALELQIVNGTPGAAPIAGLPVLLRAYDSASEVLSRTAQIDSAGVVTFTGLPRREDYFYQAELDYEDGRFYSAPQQFISTTQVITGLLPAYETTTDASGISISEQHYFVQDIGEDTVTIVEYYVFDNASDRAFIGEPGPGGRRHTLKLSVPEGAQNLRFDGLGLGRRFFQEGDVIFDTDVTVPGPQAQQVTMIYELPYDGAFSFERPTFHPVRAWDVLVPEVTGPGTPFKVAGLTDRGLQRTPSGNLYLYASDAPAAAGETLRFQLSGQPLGAELPGADARAIGLGLIALGLAIGIAFFMFTRVRAIRAEMHSTQPEQREQLLRDIAALDDAYARGKIKERSYRKQREQLKRELVEIWPA